VRCSAQGIIPFRLREVKLVAFLFREINLFREQFGNSAKSF